MPQKITVELVPETSFGKNLRSRFTQADWGIIRRYCYQENGYVCQLCGGVGPQHPVEAHETWSYDMGTQTLEDIMCLCPDCHLAHHPGFAATIGKEQVALSQLMKVNEWSKAQAMQHHDDAFKIWQERSKRKWILDISPATKLLAALKE